MPLSPMKRLPSGLGMFGLGSWRTSSKSAKLKTRPTNPEGGGVAAPWPVAWPEPRPPRRTLLEGRSPRYSPLGTPGISGGAVNPSCQNSFSGGMLPRAGKSNRMIDFLGNMKSLAPSLWMHSTLVGVPSFKARFASGGLPQRWRDDFGDGLAEAGNPNRLPRLADLFQDAETLGFEHRDRNFFHASFIPWSMTMVNQRDTPSILNRAMDKLGKAMRR